jgi:hypothetical protein
MKKLVLLLILGTAAASMWSWTRTEPVAPVGPADSANQLVADRIWIDRLPRNERDTINVFVMLSEHSAGVFQAMSQWRGNYEVFLYEAQGGELRLLYPQTGDREKARARAKRCDDGGMDYCLELDGASRGVKRYYSRKGWEIDGAQDLDAAKRSIETLRRQLEAAE